MTPQLALIARKMERKSSQKAPAPAASGLGEAFDALLQHRIDEALAVERERHSAEIQRLTAQLQQQPQQLPPAKKPSVPMTTTLHRDHLGRLLWSETAMEGKDVKFITEVARDELGGILSSRTFPIPANATYKPGKPGRLPQAEARQYQPGVPRKLYGNDPVGE